MFPVTVSQNSLVIESRFLPQPSTVLNSFDHFAGDLTIFMLDTTSFYLNPIKNLPKYKHHHLPPQKKTNTNNQPESILNLLYRIPYTLQKVGYAVETCGSHRPKIQRKRHLRSHEVVETLQCGILLHDLGKGDTCDTNDDKYMGKVTGSTSYCVTHIVNKDPSRDMKRVSFSPSPPRKSTLYTCSHGHLYASELLLFNLRKGVLEVRSTVSS